MKIFTKLNTFLNQYFSFSLLLLAPYFAFLRFNQYGYVQNAAGILLLILVGFGVLFAKIYTVGNWLFKLLLFAVLITFSLSFFPQIQSMGALLIVFLVAIAIYMLFEKHVTQLLLIFFGILALGNLLLPMQTQFAAPQIYTQNYGPVNKKLPPIIYLILDEQAGINAIPTNIIPFTGFKNQLEKFYLDAGFKVYTSAFSHYPATYNSIPNFLNFTDENISNYYFQGQKNRKLLQATLLQILAQQGYQFRIYQSDFIDYCSVKGIDVNYCYTYPAQTLSLLNQVHLSTIDRLLFLSKSFLLQSGLFQWVLHIYQYDWIGLLNHFGWSVHPWPWYQDSVSSINQPQIVAKLQKDILQEPNGTVFFAHLLFPHDPFIYDANCKIRSDPNTWKIIYGPLPAANSIQLRALRYKYYLAQDVCAEQQINNLFLALQKAGIYKDAIIIIHGDHGSRIASNWPYAVDKNGFTRENFNDYYVTLFASKIPGQNAVSIEQPQDLQTLLANDVTKITGKKIIAPKDKLFVYFYPLKENEPLVKVPLDAFK